MTKERITLFQKRQSEHQQFHKQFQSKANKVSWLRTILFISALVAAIWLFSITAYAAFVGLVLGFVLVFGFLVRWHERVRFQAQHHQLVATINGHEIARLNHRYTPENNGSAYHDDEHPFAQDLDLFGKHSLFATLNRCTTPYGNKELAQRLKTPLSPGAIVTHQAAIKELAEQTDWRQDFQAYGQQYALREKDEDFISEWIKLGNTPIAIKFGWLYPLLAVTSIITISLIGAQLIAFSWIYLILGVNLLAIRQVHPKVSQLYQSSSAGLRYLKNYQLLFNSIENRDFQTQLCKELQQQLTTPLSASKAIHQLSKLLDYLDSRSNAFYWLINTFLLTDYFLLKRIGQWQRTYLPYLETWFKALGKTEALSSMAGLAFAQPDYAYPTITDQPFEFEAQSLGHPLIPLEKVVTNDFQLTGQGQIALITGSNMAGKSTFLRTVGVNMVLAYSGAPVCARHLKLSPMSLFTSMRTHDDLEENVSSFYAELRRIQKLIGLTQTKQPVFFLLDEILKGTNTHDRHRGAWSLMLQLSQSNASGLISTHDIDLGKLSEKADNFKNYSFESEIQGDSITFDYKIKKGICERFNASTLMKNMGINIIAHDD